MDNCITQLQSISCNLDLIASWRLKGPFGSIWPLPLEFGSSLVPSCPCEGSAATSCQLYGAYQSLYPTLDRHPTLCALKLHEACGLSALREPYGLPRCWCLSSCYWWPGRSTPPRIIFALKASLFLSPGAGANHGRALRRCCRRQARDDQVGRLLPADHLRAEAAGLGSGDPRQ